MEEKILNELQTIKKELQDIRSILEPKKIRIELDEIKLSEVVPEYVKNINPEDPRQGISTLK